MNAINRHITFPLFSLTGFERTEPARMILFVGWVLLNCCLYPTIGFSCSTYKVSLGDKTMHGVNYDAWFRKPRIWFENEGYGAAFCGGNFMGSDGFSPQSGMNIHGLSFATLATVSPSNMVSQPNKKRIASRAAYLKQILHSCRTVDEVKVFVGQYDRSWLPNDVFFYTDRSGKYLVVEPFASTFGQTEKYILANFCPSVTPDVKSIRQKRYVDGNAFLRNKIDTSLAFCSALSDTMHVCRKRLGDGTLLTSIWDTKAGLVHLYFYHQYDEVKTLHLREELAKGDHAMEIPALFSPRPEFEKLLDYKIPSFSLKINTLLIVLAALFSLLGLYFPFSLFFYRSEKYPIFKWVLSGMSFLLAFYMLLLLSHTAIFFLPAPYQDPSVPIFSLFSYLPFLLIIIIIPALCINIKVWKQSSWKLPSRWLLTVGNFTWMLLIGLFSYWGLYNIFD